MGGATPKFFGGPNLAICGPRLTFYKRSMAYKPHWDWRQTERNVLSVVVFKMANIPGIIYPDSTDSPDCFPILLSISVFTLQSSCFSTVSSCSMLKINLTHVGF